MHVSEGHQHVTTLLPGSRQLNGGLVTAVMVTGLRENGLMHVAVVVLIGPAQLPVYPQSHWQENEFVNGLVLVNGVVPVP
jgi:hypothetical protein